MLGRPSEAEPFCRSTLEGRTRVLGPDHPDTLATMKSLAELLQAQGRISEAEPLHKSSFEGSLKVLGPSHPDCLARMS